jgi:hypothetical protein
MRKITTELAKIEEGKVKAIAEGDKVYLMIQDAPAELRRLADALERIDVREIKALVAYAKPGAVPTPRKASARNPVVPEIVAAATEKAKPEDLEDRVEDVLARLRAKAKKATFELAAVEGGVAKIRVAGASPEETARLGADVRAALAKDVPELSSVELS